MLLEGISVNQLIVAFMAIAGVVTVILNFSDRYNKKGKRIDDMEVRLTTVEDKLRHSDKEGKLVIKALLALLSKDPQQQEKILGELNEFLLDK